MIETIVGGCFAKVALDGGDALFHQSFYLLLIPVDGLWVREVEDGIFDRHAASGIFDMEALVDDLIEETVLRGEVG